MATTDAVLPAIEQVIDHKRPPKVLPPAVFLMNPKFPHNVGAALRACSCWGINQLWWTGQRVNLELEKGQRLPREERMKGYRDVQLFNDDRPFDRLADEGIEPSDGVTPVAVELLPSSENLANFEHPEKAIYVFGPEDGSINQVIRRLCHRFVFIPTHHCLNLAAAINVVLYDRSFKLGQAGMYSNTEEALKEYRGPVWAQD